MNITRLALAAAMVSGFAVANATTLFDRGLPTANLNNVSGANRSNVAWATSNPWENVVWYMGDDFTLAGSNLYKVSKVTVWVVGGATVPDNGSPLTLWGGTAGGSISKLSNTFNYSLVTYSNGDKYQLPNGNMSNIWQIDFDVDWNVYGGDLTRFYVGGKQTGTTPFIHASNAALSGSAQPGADNYYQWAYLDGSDFFEAGAGSSLGNGWDKASDFNVRVEGSAVPGPAAIIPFIVGGVAMLRRRRK